jgi:hypothetical protein
MYAIADAGPAVHANLLLDACHRALDLDYTKIQTGQMKHLVL